MDEAAVTEQLRNSIRQLAGKYVSAQSEDMEDIVSMAVFQLLRLRDLKQLPNDEIWWTYPILRLTVVSSFKNWLVKKYRDKSIKTTIHSLDEMSYGNDVNLEKLEFKIALNQVVETLRSKDRQFFVFLEQAAASGTEDAVLAESLGMRTSTFSSRKLALLKKIMMKLQEQV